MMDQEPEVDNGYVTLIKAKKDKKSGELVETDDNTGVWAWNTHTMMEQQLLPNLKVM